MTKQQMQIRKTYHNLIVEAWKDWLLFGYIGEDTLWKFEKLIQKQRKIKNE